MSQWAGGVLTAAGRVLQAKVESGTTLTLTKIKLGDGTESMSAVDNLTDLVSPKAELGISSATSDGDVATITGVMSATLLQAGFYCREWGLFAQDPDAGEILYMITIDSQPEWLPASTEAAQVSATYAMNIAVANATNIVVNIDPAGLVDVDMLNELLGVAERSKAYNVGDLVSMPGLPAEHYLRCVTAGTTGANMPVIGTVADGDLIADGTVVWQVTKAMSAAELGYRQPSTAYTAGAIAYHPSLPTGWYLECTTDGTTDAGELVITSPSVGGTVTDGTVVWTVHNVYTLYGGALNGKKGIFNGADDSQIVLAGGSGTSSTERCGAKINLYGEDHENNPGTFELLVKDSNANKWLVVKPDGSFVWNNNDLAGSAIVAKSLGTNGYIKYASGLIMQWGHTGTGTTNTVTFPIAFTTATRVVATPETGKSQFVGYTIEIRQHSATQFIVNKSADFDANWIAIGY